MYLKGKSEQVKLEQFMSGLIHSGQKVRTSQVRTGQIRIGKGCKCGQFQLAIWSC